MVENSKNRNFADIVINSKAQVADQQRGDVLFSREEPEIDVKKVKDNNKQYVFLKRFVESFGKPSRVSDKNTIDDDSGNIQPTL